MKILAFFIGCVLSFNLLAQVGPDEFEGRWRIYFSDHLAVVKCGLSVTYSGNSFQENNSTFYSFDVSPFTTNCDYLNVGARIFVEGGSFNLRDDGRVEGYFWTAGDTFWITNSFIPLDGLTWDGGMSSTTAFVGTFNGSKGAKQ